MQPVTAHAAMDPAPRSPTSPTSPSTPLAVNDALPQIFALVIGIDVYLSPVYGNLKYSVSDANKFEGFLKDKLKVSHNHIISLRNEKATRAKIILAFEEMLSNKEIVKDEAAIIIYFAGHGASVPKPQEWADWTTAEGHIEMMCPSDMNVKVDGKVVDGIPDRTLSVLLNRLSESKGDNITLILDCCSSGGLNRSIELDQTDRSVPRRIFNPPPISGDCDNKLLAQEQRDASIAKGFSGKYRGSHVLLAACGRKQLAYEHPGAGGGLFTGALLKSLSRYEVNDLTYSSLMHGLNNMPEWQTPHCEGQHVDRRLFNKRALGADGAFILAHRVNKETGISQLHAGAAQGITLGSTFGIHYSNLKSDSNKPCGFLVVTEVNPFTSKLAPSLEDPVSQVPSKFYGKMIKRGAEGVSIYSNNRLWLETIFPPETCTLLSAKLTDDPQKALLWLIRDENGKVRFERNDPMITPFIGPRFPHVVDEDKVELIQQVARGYIHFNYHLTRTGEDFKGVFMEMRTLSATYSNNYDMILTPIGDDLIQNEPAKIVVDEDVRLGMTIFNQTYLPLYPHVFYFDPSDLEIIDWYMPPFGAGTKGLSAAVDAPLPPKSTLAIGYSDGGVSPWQFLLRKGDDKDVGFFKIFLTSSPADLSSITQESPFVENNIPSRAGRSSLPKFPDVWGSKLSTIIQLRYPEKSSD